MSTTEPRFDVYQNVTNRIIELLEAGVIPWRKPWKSSGPPMNALTKRRYQGINVWLLNSSDYESNLWLTFHQVQNLHGKVNRSEKGHPAIYWEIRDQPETQSEIEGLDHEVTEIRRPRIRYWTVFNVEQCSGLP